MLIVTWARWDVFKQFASQGQQCMFCVSIRSFWIFPVALCRDLHPGKALSRGGSVHSSLCPGKQMQALHEDGVSDCMWEGEEEQLLHAWMVLPGGVHVCVHFVWVFILWDGMKVHCSGCQRVHCSDCQRVHCSGCQYMIRLPGVLLFCFPSWSFNVHNVMSMSHWAN